MPINPAIAMGVRGIELQDPLAQYGRVAAIQQAQQQNALAQQQLAQARRAEEQQNALSAAFRDAYNPDTGGIDANRLRSTLASSGFGSQIPTVEKALGELETQKLTRQKLTGEIAEGQTKLIDARLKQSRSFLDTLDPMDPNAPAQYMAWHEANHRDSVLGPLLASRGVTAEQSRARIEQAIAAGPAAFAQLINQSKLGTDRFMELNKPTTQVINQGGQNQVIQLPGLGGAPTSVGVYKDVPLPSDVAQQKKEIARAGASNINLPPQERAFETGLGAAQAKKVMDDKAVADDAKSIIATVAQGRQLLQSGMITGFGADYLTKFGAALNQAGINFAEDRVANTQAFAANMAQNVGRVVKQFGAGTGLSNADREYAEKMAGGNISLDRKSLERILDINERAARNVIELHNKNVSNIKTNIPLTVELPPVTAPAAPAGRPPLDAIFKPK